MSSRGYTVQIKNLALNTTEKDVRGFLAFCGSIQCVEFVRAGESVCTAYVTFRNPHAVETAVLLSGDTILDQPVCITQWGHYKDDHDLRNHTSWKIEDESNPRHSQKGVPSTGEAVSSAQGVVKTMAAKGYEIGKDALGKAKAIGESHQVPTKVANLSERIGLTDKIFAGVEATRSVDQRYHISGTTKSVVSATQRNAFSAANAVVNSSYFSKGALWLSGALSKASQVAGDLGNRGVTK